MTLNIKWDIFCNSCKSPYAFFNLYSKKSSRTTRTLNTMKSIIEYAFLAFLATAVNAQASLEQCAAQICCTHGNQDLSETCWSQCSSYQAQLAEIGCHILAPKPTSSSAAPVAPTLTTSWGPGQGALFIHILYLIMSKLTF